MRLAPDRYESLSGPLRDSPGGCSIQDDPPVSEVRAPNLYGLSPDEARLVCYDRALGLTIRVADMVEVRGWDPSRVRVTEQWPIPGSRMDSEGVTVLVDIVEGGDEAGVREPRRPSPTGPSGAPSPDVNGAGARR